MRVTAITCVKNEGPFLLEWIAWNRLIGVTDFLVYSNDCTDGTDALLDALAAAGIVAHLPNPARGRRYQMEALKAAKTHPAVTGADWAWIADVDEFLNIRAGDGTIAALVAACGDPQAISVSFQFFANGGVETFEDRPVVAQFDRSHNPDIWGTDTAIEVKTLVRRDFPLGYYGAHRPFHDPELPPERQPAWTDGSGRPVPRAFRLQTARRRLRAFPARGARLHATLNHYALRSLESYLVKTDRGDVNRAHRAFDATYWQARNDPAHEDRSIQDRLPALAAEIAALKALPGVGARHADAVAAHRARIAALMADPEYRDLARALRAAPRICAREAELCARLGVA
ncbi:glycosyltransferase family 2 protein [Roseivivax isoporae]|uniref:Glycosyl transferase family 2 n=1 Tax=Roseivivax isoporae LMG 25204 TaxID=1449351 RepID=X7F660_9RHOB|nr:glycosyltransferase family 2 protein [Roseivivax isoporae]ETX28305.1 glycosyl transferase family 2 [Roseivivax isoporae LMG 25204]